jgi:hypothetical protein
MNKNNWITTSLSDRTSENLCDFTLTINPYKFTQDTFKNNCSRVAKELYQKNSNIYVLYSGGIDSECVLKTFLDNDLPVTPIMLVTPYNKPELQYAVNFYKEKNIKPIIFSYEEDEMFSIMQKNCNDNGYYSFISALQLEICKYVSDKGGDLITGAGEPFTPVGYSNSLEETETIDMAEFEFYIDNSYPNLTGSFFTYDLALHSSMLSDIVFTGDMQRSKCNLYEVNYRKKIFWDREFYTIFSQKALNIPKWSVTIPSTDYKNALTSDQSTTFT